MRRHRPISRSASIRSAGYSLVEVMVALLVSCIMVTAVFGVAVTAKLSSNKGMHRLMFNQGVAQISAQLKQYVTACGCIPSSGVCPAPSCTTVPGPNSNNGANSWSLNHAGNAITDSQGDVWAMRCGVTHSIRGLVPALEAAPYNGSVSYTVSWSGGSCPSSVPSASDAPAIAFSANWTEP